MHLLSLYYVYRAVMILSPLLFMPSLYSHSNSKNFTLLVPSHFYTDLITSSAGAMLQAAKKETRSIYTGS